MKGLVEEMTDLVVITGVACTHMHTALLVLLYNSIAYMYCLHGPLRAPWPSVPGRFEGNSLISHTQRASPLWGVGSMERN